MFIALAKPPIQVVAPLITPAPTNTAARTVPSAPSSPDGLQLSPDGRNLSSPEWTASHQARLDTLDGQLRDILGRRGSRGVSDQLTQMRDEGVLLDSDSENMTTLDRLQRLATLPLGDGLDRRRLLSSTLDHLHDPETISQKDQGSCVPASVQYQLAETQPAEYARLVEGLASAGGQVVTQKGELLEREPESARRPGGRDLTSSLLQDSFTEFANGPEDYDPRRDVSTGDHDPSLHQANPYIENSGHMEGGHPGLYPHEVRRLADAVLPGRFENRYVPQGEPGGALDEMQQSLEQDGTVLAGLKWARGGHRLVVTGMDEESVTLWNPWGEDNGSTSGGAPSRDVLSRRGAISMSREMFSERLQTYVVSTQ